MKFSSAQAVETAFYDAIQHADLEAMMLTWHQHEAVCIHPFGHRIEGREAVCRSWRDIFSHGIDLQFSLSNARHFKSERLAVHLVHENISVAHAGDFRRSIVLATNIYRLVGDSWHIVLHHASPVPQDVQTSEADPGRVH